MQRKRIKNKVNEVLKCVVLKLDFWALSDFRRK